MAETTSTKRAGKAARIVEILERLHPQIPMPLDHTDSFTLLVAVVLSAQTTDKKVNEITPALFAEAGTPEAMAALPVARIHHLIKQVGLAPQKAKNLSGLAQMLVTKHGGEVPRTFEELEELPGVGHKTASVVMSHAFGLPAFPVDTHIHRLAWRWGLSDGSSVERTEADLKKAFDESLWNTLHLRFIYFGRAHCPALRHDLQACPICSWAAPKEVHAAAGQRDKSKSKAKARSTSKAKAKAKAKASRDA